MNAQAIFLLGGLFSISPWASPPLALAVGIAFGLALPHPFERQTKKWTKYLLQASVVGLGFGMNFHEVLKAGSTGVLWTALGIAFSMTVGSLLGRILKVESVAAYLISAGTAICGGSAIAAVGPILNAGDEELSISLGTVFILNSIALMIFPAIGAAMGLSQSQFGLWAALAIHDTSSVVGAAAKYGAAALAIATTVKLARALWIVPLSLATAAFKGSQAKIHLPWFILYFVLAAAANSYLPAAAPGYRALYQVGRVGLTATLFLIGTGISKKTLKKVGVRPLVQGIALWLIVGSISLALIKTGYLFT